MVAYQGLVFIAFAAIVDLIDKVGVRVAQKDRFVTIVEAQGARCGRLPEDALNLRRAAAGLTKTTEPNKPDNPFLPRIVILLFPRLRSGLLLEGL